MRLPVPLRARLLQSLLLLTLLLVAVCGMQKHQSPEAQPRSPLQKAQVSVSEDKKEDLLVARNSDTEHVRHRREENSAEEKPGMRQEHPEPRFRLPFIDLPTCEASVSCRSVLLILYVNFVAQDLPSCPCTYPVQAQQEVISLFDEHQGAEFGWRDASGPQELPHNSSARFCLRSLLSAESSILASQHCCYDDQGHLLTRGNGAGTPELISPELSTNLSFSLDHLPWSQCKEEWAPHHAVMPPNNGLSCPENPPQEQNLSLLQDS